MNWVLAQQATDTIPFGERLELIKNLTRIRRQKESDSRPSE